MKDRTTPTLLAVVLLAAGLAGCVGEDSEEIDPASLEQQGLVVDVSPKQGDASTNFTFDATGTPGAEALTFNWSFGDGAEATGDVVHHTFRWTNNLYEVEVTASLGNRTFTETVEVPIGSGENADPTVHADQGVPWAAHGEDVTFTAHASDPDGDPVEVKWLVAKKVEQGGHGHGGDGHDHGHGGETGQQADPYGIPEPTGETGTNVTLSFTESGTYRIVAKATDPKGGSSTDRLELKVTRTVPKPTFTMVETGTLAAGTAAGQTGVSVSEILYEVQQPSQNSFVDAARYDLRLIYPGEGTFSLDWSNSTAPAELDLYLQDGNGDNVYALDALDPTAESVSTPVELSKGSYTILVRANAGAQIDYRVTLDLDLKIPGLTVGLEDDGHGGHEH